MKKLRNSFVLVVALATIGITLMSNKVVNGKKNNLDTGRCFTDPITVKLRCENMPEIISSTTTCDLAQLFELYKAHVFSMNPANYIEYDDVPVQCEGGDTFCCAQVIRDWTWTGGNFEGPCPGQPYFDLEGTYAQYEIFQVHCKYN